MNTNTDAHYLPIGSRLNEFEIIERLGEGGFSIVYLAWDHSLERQVALKEYMPAAVASRSQTSLVSVRSERHRETFDVGLKSFINEGKLLAQFDHPALVKVYRFWEANGTAYMAMPFYKGLTFKETVRSLPEPPDETWLMDVLNPLTAALKVIHAKNCYHRDIAPDNIIILAESMQPLLLDFGAARRVIDDMTQSLTVILKPGYAPVEQYSEIPGLIQGAWTDVYALGATVYWAITGKPPPTSVGRIVRDSCLPLADVAHGKYGASFLQAIDRALKVLPEQRTPSIEAFRQDLGIDLPSTLTSTRWMDPEATVIRSTSKASSISVSPQSLNTTETRQKKSSTPDLVDIPTQQSRTPRQTSSSRPASLSPHPPALPPLRPSVWNSRIGLIVGLLAIFIAIGIITFNLARNQVKKPIPPGTPTLQSSVEVPSTPSRPSPEASENVRPLPNLEPVPAALPTQNVHPIDPRPLAPIVELPPLSAKTDSPTSAPRTSKNLVSDVPVKTAKVERKKTQASDSAECARLMTQLSLGDDNPSASARLRALNCR